MQLRARPIAALMVYMVVTGCASTGSTFRSGVGDTFLERAPWYAGAGVIERGAIAHLPITFQRGATQPGSFDPKSHDNSPIALLLADMNAFLDSLHTTVPVAAATKTVGTPPDVQFGCEQTPQDDCENSLVRQRLAVARPSRSWIAWTDSLATAAGADRVLVLTLEVGNYRPRQKNLRGQKEIELGTDYSPDVPWLTALDKPAQVLQLTGALMDRQGRAVRIGAEGLIARRTNVVLLGFGIQSVISDEDVERARTARRDDLPGAPLGWQVALRNMVAQLTGTARMTN